MALQAILFILSCLLFSGITDADKCIQSDIILVQGVGRRSVETSIAVVRLGVEAQGPTSAAVQKTIAEKSTTLVDFLEQKNVMKLRTTGVSLFAQFNRKNPPTVTGYRGSNTVTFEVEVTKSGAVLDGAVENGASQISGISFKPTAEVSKAGRDDALKDAVAAARSEAMTVAMASGISVGRALRVEVTDNFFPKETASKSFAPAAGGAGSGAAPPTSQIIGGEQIITARVSITYSTGSRGRRHRF